MWDEKTGNPTHDNAARKLNKNLRRATDKRFRVHARGWKRRKVIKRVEGAKYMELVYQLTLHLLRRDGIIR